MLVLPWPITEAPTRWRSAAATRSFPVEAIAACSKVEDETMERSDSKAASRPRRISMKSFGTLDGALLTAVLAVAAAPTSLVFAMEDGTPSKLLKLPAPPDAAIAVSAAVPLPIASGAASAAPAEGAISAKASSTELVIVVGDCMFAALLLPALPFSKFAKPSLTLPPPPLLLDSAAWKHPCVRREWTFRN